MSYVNRCLIIVGLGLSLPFLGCFSSSTESPDASANASKPAKAVAESAPAVKLVYPLPEGNSDALLEFINEMAAREPVGADDEARTKDIGHMMKARIAAADKLLTLPNGDQFDALSARTKLESLRVMQMIGQPGADDKFEAYAEDLSKSKKSELATVGKIGLFQNLVDEAMSNSGDGTQAVERFRQLVDQSGTSEPVFFAGQEATAMLQQAGKLDAATELLGIIADSFSDHENEQVAGEAQMARSQIKLLAFDSKFRELLIGNASVGEELAGLAHEMLTTDPINPTAVGMVMQAAQQLEYSGHVEDAQALYSKVSSATKDSEFHEQVAGDLKNAEMRLGLIGEPFELTGTVVGDSKLDWSQYKGKVVLVDFWATWCGPCLREVPNIKKNYARFKDQGFEVVSVNLDNELETVEGFLKNQPLPWPTVVGEEEDEFGFENPNAVRCGVKAIPFLVLVGKDGNVAALHVRDKLLDEKLVELLGEPDEEMLEITDPETEESSDDYSPDTETESEAVDSNETGDK